MSLGKETVSTNALASTMETAPASVNDMLKRLAQKGLITHKKYKGAKISDKGKHLALKIIRKHRLWEVFLVDKLHFNWDQVHEIAEQLEHIKSPALTDRLDAFLGFPKFDPHGDPIPDKEGNMNVGVQLNIAELEAGERGTLVNVTNDDAKLLQHLDSIQLRIGTELTVLSKSDFDQSIQVETQNGQAFLSKEVCSYLKISKG